jgi:GntR family histidine utilization transcriptional repressor
MMAVNKPIISLTIEKIDKLAPEPIYGQIKKNIEQKISTGDWLAGQKLPSENDLVVALGVSRMTVNRALRELTQKGLIHRVHGLGSFVAEKPRHASLIELEDIALEVTGNGKQHSSKVEVLEKRLASPEVAADLDVPINTELYYMNAVHYQNDIPIQLESRYVNPALIPEFLLQDFTKITSTAYLLSQFQPDEMEHIVSAVISDGITQNRLKIGPFDACLQLNRRTWKNKQVVTQVTLIYPGSRYNLGARYATSEYNTRIPNKH